MTPMMPGQPQPPIEPEGMGGPMPTMSPMMMGEQPAEPMEDEGYSGEGGSSFHDYVLMETNLARKLKKKKTEDGQPLLEWIGTEVKEGFDADYQTVSPWLDRNQEYINSALLITEEKTYPWPNASNVKYPLIATAAMQFSARAYPSLVPNDNNVVKTRVIGFDPDGSRAERAVRVSKHMSYQIMYKCPNWEEDMDRLLMYNPIVGVSFKKTYVENGNLCSKWITPDKFIINYYAESLEDAYRKSEIVYLTKNQILEKVRNDEEFLDVLEEELEAGPPVRTEDERTNLDEELDTAPQDESAPHKFICQYTYFDLDKDGYEEPYMVVIHYESAKVVRIIARWASDGVEYNSDDEIVRITPVEYFTKFGFIPNPESNIYDNGFGFLLGSLNDAINTILNQLLDAGTLANLQSGFLSKGLRIKMGEVGFKPGEWKVANATPDELKNGIVPLPVKEPSPVLFQLLGLLIESGNKLASIAEIFTGKMPGQNTPATTTQETVEQGMKVFTAIYKRIYRALMKEFRKVYNLNRIYPELKESAKTVLNIPLQASDYDGEADDIIPAADPTGDSATTRMMKYQQVAQLLVPLGVVNVPVLGKLMADALEIPSVDQLIVQPQPQPDPKVQETEAKIKLMEAKGQQDAAKANMDVQLKRIELEYKKEMENLKMQVEMMKMEMEQRKGELDMQSQMQKAQTDQMVTQIKGQQEVQANEQKLRQQDEQFKQKSRQQEEAHQQKITQQRDRGGRPPSPNTSKKPKKK